MGWTNYLNKAFSENSSLTIVSYFLCASVLAQWCKVQQKSTTGFRAYCVFQTCKLRRSWLKNRCIFQFRYEWADFHTKYSISSIHQFAKKYRHARSIVVFDTVRYCSRAALFEQMFASMMWSLSKHKHLIIILQRIHTFLPVYLCDVDWQSSVAFKPSTLRVFTLWVMTSQHDSWVWAHSIHIKYQKKKHHNILLVSDRFQGPLLTKWII